MSTYKLTSEAAFQGAIAAGAIRLFVLHRSSERSECILAGPPNVVAKLERSWGDGNDEAEIRRQQILAACALFVEGRVPTRLLFKCVSQRKGISEMRVLAPAPGCRLVGGFLDDSVFVVLGIYRREEIAWRHGISGNAQGIRWKAVIEAAEMEWKVLFPGIPPMIPAAIRKSQGE